MLIIQELERDDVIRAAAKLPKRVAEALVEMDPGSVYVAGGHVRSVIAQEPPSDVDLFPATEAAAEELIDRLKREDETPFKTEFATTFGGRVPIQVVTRWTFEKPDDLLDHFDFTVARALIFRGPNEWSGACDSRFYRDLAARRLRVDEEALPRESIEAGGTLLRLAKYCRKGYSASPETIAKIAADAVLSTDAKRLLEGATAGSAGGITNDAVADALQTELIASFRGVDPGYWPPWVRGMVE